MSLDTFKKSIKVAKAICEDAAAVAELTSQMKPKTTFVIPADGIMYGQLVTELRNRVSPKVEITQEGESIRIVTNNPTLCQTALKGLGVSVTLEGEVKADVHVQR